MKTMGELWAKMTDKEKKHYGELAAEDQKRYTK